MIPKSEAGERIPTWGYWSTGKADSYERVCNACSKDLREEIQRVRKDSRRFPITFPCPACKHALDTNNYLIAAFPDPVDVPIKDMAGVERPCPECGHPVALKRCARCGETTFKLERIKVIVAVHNVNTNGWAEPHWKEIHFCAPCAVYQRCINQLNRPNNHNRGGDGCGCLGLIILFISSSVAMPVVYSTLRHFFQ